MNVTPNEKISFFSGSILIFNFSEILKIYASAKHMLLMFNELLHDFVVVDIEHAHVYQNIFKQIMLCAFVSMNFI